MDRARAGDVDAYATLVRRHQGAAVRLAHVVCGAMDAEDAAQEGFVKAYYALDRFRRDGSGFRPWVLRIVANEARNRRRAVGRRTRYELAVTSASGAEQVARSPETLVVAAETSEVLLAALARLPTRQRDVVACRYLLGLSERETAEVLGVPAGTVKSRLARGLSQLRTNLPGEAP